VPLAPEAANSSSPKPSLRSGAPMTPASRLENEGDGTGARDDEERNGAVNATAGAKKEVVPNGGAESCAITEEEDEEEDEEKEEREDEVNGDGEEAGEEELMVAGEVEMAEGEVDMTSSSSWSPSFGSRLMVAPPRRLRLSMSASLLLSSCAAGGSSSVLSMIEIHHFACARKKLLETIIYIFKIYVKIMEKNVRFLWRCRRPGCGRRVGGGACGGPCA
jgi:hypothetical protein